MLFLTAHNGHELPHALKSVLSQNKNIKARDGTRHLPQANSKAL